MQNLCVCEAARPSPQHLVKCGISAQSQAVSTREIRLTDAAPTPTPEHFDEECSGDLDRDHRRSPLGQMLAGTKLGFVDVQLYVHAYPKQIALEVMCY